MALLCQVCENIDFETATFGHSPFELPRSGAHDRIGPRLGLTTRRWTRTRSYPYQAFGQKVMLGTVDEVRRSADGGCPLCSLLLDSPLEYEGEVILLRDQSARFQRAARHGQLRFETNSWPSTDRLLEKPGALRVSLKLRGDWQVQAAPRQKCWSALCLLDRPDSTFHRIGEFVDHRLLRQWLEGCRAHHHSCRHPDMSFRYFSFTDLNRDGPLRLIDTEANTIDRVDDLPALSYACLSYVWGRMGDQEMLRKSTPGWTYGAFGERESVPLPRRVSKTVRDAVALTKKLGLRYLWVDALCIVQDDVGEKDGQMAIMAQIYSHAAVCIIAAAGTNAAAGLPGVSTARSLLHQSATEVGGHLWIGRRMPDMAVLLDESKWMTRGWTYQEFFFSRRCIVFTESETFWSCGISTHRESRDEEDTGRSENYLNLVRNRAYDADNTSVTIGNWIAASSNKDKICLWEFYRICVSEYTQRTLTYDEDAVDAFSSLADSFARLYGPSQRVHFNIPQGILLAGLYWKRHKTAARLTRRRKLGSPLFPSWCWAAWQGHITYDYVPFESATAIHPGTELEIIKPSLLPAVPALHLMHEFAHVPSDDDSAERIWGLLPSVAVLAKMDLEDDDVEDRVRVLTQGGLTVGWCEFDDDRLPFAPEHCAFMQLGVSETEDGDLRCHALAVELLDLPIYMTFGVRKGDAFLDQLLQSVREGESYLPINDEDLHLPRFTTPPSTFETQRSIPDPPPRGPICLARRIGVAAIDLPGWEDARDRSKSIVLLG